MEIIHKCDVVVGYPMTQTHVLMGIRKTFPWKEIIMGAGGKVEKGENWDPRSSMQREFMEELGIYVEIKNLTKVAEFRLLTEGDDVAVRRNLMVYTTLCWENDPTETPAMVPYWTSKKQLRSHFPRMLSGDGTWIPFILSGHSLIGEIHRKNDEQGSIIKVEFELVENFPWLLF
jgi:hypothetical protein